MPKSPDLEDMKATVSKAFSSIGFEIEFDPEAALNTFGCGDQLTVGELRALPPKTPVYVTYKQGRDEGKYRIHNAMRVTIYDDENTWALSDGTSFGADFEPDDKTDGSPCIEHDCKDGLMIIYRAVPIVADTTVKKPKGKTRGATRSAP